MKDLNELAPDIYGVLLLASMGGKGQGLEQAVREAGVKEDNIALVLKSAEKIIEERDKHKDELANILTRDELSEDESEARAHDYLKSQGINQALIEHILIYNTFVMVKTGTQELVAVAEKEGYSERQIKKVMRKEMKLSRELVDQMYDAATLSFEETVAGNPEKTTKRPVIKEQKPARLLLLSGIAFIIIAYMNYQMRSMNYIGYTSLILGVVFLRIGIKRAMD